MREDIAFSKVVLPEPEELMMAVKVPGASEAEIDCSSGPLSDLDFARPITVLSLVSDSDVIVVTFKLRICTSTGVTSSRLSTVLTVDSSMCELSGARVPNAIVLRRRRVALQFVNPAVSVVPVLIVPATCLSDDMLPCAAALATLKSVEAIAI